MIIFVGGEAFKVVPLSGVQWAICLILGALSLPMAVIIRLIPDMWIGKLLPRFWRKSLAPELIEAEEAKIKALQRRGSRPEDLSFIRSIRGGRSSSMKFN